MFFLVMLLSLPSSVQTLVEPSFFGTNTMGLANGLDEGLITSVSSRQRGL